MSVYGAKESILLSLLTNLNYPDTDMNDDRLWQLCCEVPHLMRRDNSANAKKWETEIQTLKNNNARLTAALQESSVNVEKWKEQLNNYKEENIKLRKKLQSSSSSDGSSATVRDLEQSLSDCECKLKRKEEELETLSQHSSEELHFLREKNVELVQRIQQLELEQKESSDANIVLSEKNRQTKILEAKMRQVNDIRSEMETKMKEMNNLQQKLTSVCKT